MELKQSRDGVLRTLRLPNGNLLYGATVGISPEWYDTRREALQRTIAWNTFVANGYKRNAPGKTDALRAVAWAKEQLEAFEKEE